MTSTFGSTIALGPVDEGVEYILHLRGLVPGQYTFALDIHDDPTQTPLLRLLGPGIELPVFDMVPSALRQRLQQCTSLPRLSKIEKDPVETNIPSSPTEPDPEYEQWWAKHGAEQQRLHQMAHKNHLEGGGIWEYDTQEIGTLMKAPPTPRISSPESRHTPQATSRTPLASSSNEIMPDSEGDDPVCRKSNHSLRDAGKKGVPSVEDTDRARTMLSLTRRKLSVFLNKFKEQIKTVSKREKNRGRTLAHLAKLVISEDDTIPITLPLYYRLAFMRSHIDMGHGEKEHWKMVDRGLYELRQEGDQDFVGALNIVYEMDVSSYGDPAKTTIRIKSMNDPIPKWLDSFWKLTANIEQKNKGENDDEEEEEDSGSGNGGDDGANGGDGDDGGDGGD